MQYHGPSRVDAPMLDNESAPEKLKLQLSGRIENRGSGRGTLVIGTSRLLFRAAPSSPNYLTKSYSFHAKPSVWSFEMVAPYKSSVLDEEVLIWSFEPDTFCKFSILGNKIVVLRFFHGFPFLPLSRTSSTCRVFEHRFFILDEQHFHSNTKCDSYVP